MRKEYTLSLRNLLWSSRVKGANGGYVVAGQFGGNFGVLTACVRDKIHDKRVGNADGEYDLKYTKFKIFIIDYKLQLNDNFLKLY